MAIKVNELRLGSWLVFDNLIMPHEYIQVNARFFCSLAGGRPLADLSDKEELNQYWKPIPLSPEVLLACGFEKLPGSKSVYRIIIEGLEISVNPTLSFAYIDTEWGQASIKNPIFKYLHQVQNLVHTLTQAELVFNPNTLKQ